MAANYFKYLISKMRGIMLKFRPMNNEEYSNLIEKETLENYIKEIEVYKDKFIKSFKGKTPRQFAEKQFREMLPLKEKSPDNFLWMANEEKSGQEIGYIWYTIRHNRKSVLLSYIFVKNEFRNHGFGTEMIHYMEKHLIENFPKIKWILLQVFRHNTHVKRLYKHLGFWTFYKSFVGWNMIKRLPRHKIR
jgi:ribosomal protein S18 acetylase RimI-like enzyme